MKKRIAKVLKDMAIDKEKEFLQIGSAIQGKCKTTKGIISYIEAHMKKFSVKTSKPSLTMEDWYSYMEEMFKLGSKQTRYLWYKGLPLYVHPTKGDCVVNEDGTFREPDVEEQKIINELRDALGGMRKID